MTPKQFAQRVANLAEEYQEDTDKMAEWLEYRKYLNCGEVFVLTDERRAELTTEYKTYCAETAEADLLEEQFTKVEVEVEIEVEI